MRGGPARCTLGAKAWITAGSATAQWKARSARRYPPPPKRLRSSKSNPGLTNGSGQNIIVEIRGSRRRVADIKSESRPASNRNWWPASYWNAWPASSESARGRARGGHSRHGRDDDARRAAARRLHKGGGRIPSNSNRMNSKRTKNPLPQTSRGCAVSLKIKCSPGSRSAKRRSVGVPCCASRLLANRSIPTSSSTSAVTRSTWTASWNACCRCCFGSETCGRARWQADPFRKKPTLAPAL